MAARAGAGRRCGTTVLGRELPGHARWGGFPGTAGCPKGVSDTKQVVTKMGDNQQNQTEPNFVTDGLVIESVVEEVSIVGMCGVH